MEELVQVTKFPILLRCLLCSWSGAHSVHIICLLLLWGNLLMVEKNLVVKQKKEIQKASRKTCCKYRRNWDVLYLPCPPSSINKSKHKNLNISLKGASLCTRFHILFQSLEQQSTKTKSAMPQWRNRHHTLGADLEFSAESINPRRPAVIRLGLFTPAGEDSDGFTLFISDRGLVATRAGFSYCSACARPLSPAVNLLGLLWTPSVQSNSKQQFQDLGRYILTLKHLQRRQTVQDIYFNMKLVAT